MCVLYLGPSRSLANAKTVKRVGLNSEVCMVISTEKKHYLLVVSSL